MNFGAARLGFWFRPPATGEDRSVTKSTNVLIVYDLNGVHQSYGADPEGWPDPAVISAAIAARETALGFTPTTVTSYAAFNAMSDEDLANYAHIWDTGYDTMITTAAATKMKTYLQSGGAMFFIGENGYFVDRDNTISSIISELGGGTIGVNNDFYQGTSTIQPEFLLANNNATVTFNAVNSFSSIGTGTVMVRTPSLIHAVVWKTGSLSGAPTAAICCILDVNWIDGTANTQQNLIDNISIVLNKK